MTQAEAIRLVAVLAASFRQDVTDETAVLWANDLIPFELTDGLEAADITRKTSVFMPSLAEFLAIMRDCRNSRLETRALPSVGKCCDDQGFGHFYRDHADDAMRERVKALLKVPTDRRKDTTILEAFAEIVGR
jgi:hypothetical protein